MAKTKSPARSLPFVTAELSRRLSVEAHHRAIDLLKQMLIDAVLAGHHPVENAHERQDPADPS